jgi:ABC-2 type transport system ATP-binding protein
VPVTVPVPRSGPTSGNPSAALSIRDLTVAFGSVIAVDGLTLDVTSGSITALLGPNGAGKTTTLDVCEGLRPATSGTVSVLGRDPWRADADHRARVGVMLQAAGIPSGLRAIEAVRTAASLYAFPLPLDSLIERLGLADLGRRPYRRLSGGEKQRVGLAVALVGRPELVILDEPTSGMDPLHRQQTWQLLSELRSAGTTVVITTHQIDEAESIADEIALIARGRLVQQGAPATFTGDAPYTVSFAAPPRLPIEQLLTTPGIAVDEATEASSGAYRVIAAQESGVLAAVTGWGQANGVTLQNVRAGRASLEDVVLNLVDWAETR